ncbi:MAG TPA: methyltransferase domain-containing protein [Blastocatellia bacterium]|nr:methyltransferase domain-containing protein [Blastocatellia bacterium]
MPQQGKDFTEYLETNRNLWNGWTALHQKSAFYDLAAFESGKSSLNSVELEELGDVSGKTLLHLQCHFGMDTLSWARLGAQVTGVDFSDKAIALARSLSEKLALDARFVCSNIYDLPDVLQGEFDIVFTSYGVLSWLPDLRRWAEIVAHYLKPGGTFYIVEFHPVVSLLDEEDPTKITYPYFHSPVPLQLQAKGSYADPGADFTHVEYAWIHSISDVINAVIAAGLRIEFFHEFPFSPYPCWPFVEEKEPGQWTIKGRPDALPLLFSLKATR